MGQRRVSQRGFTLLEVLIVVTLIAIVLGISTASFAPMIDRTNARETAALLKANVNLARGEAIVRGGWIAMCGSSDGQSCQDSYDDGWVVFQDVDKSQSLTAADKMLNKVRQKHASLTIVVDELSNGGAGPLYFNFKGIPDRPIRYTTKIGEIEEGIELLANGVIANK